MTSKILLRTQFRHLRAIIKPEVREKAAHQVAIIFSQQLMFQTSEHIGCYLAYKEEFDTVPLIETIWQAKKKCYLPVLTDNRERPLEFVRYTHGAELERNRFGILEPYDKVHSIAAQDLDLVIIPLIAFDNLGHRLGTGGGYYDRIFQFRGEQKSPPTLMGLAFAIQEADALPDDPWDIALDCILTEKGVRWIRKELISDS